jgi:hypothetical protein
MVLLLEPANIKADCDPLLAYSFRLDAYRIVSGMPLLSSSIRRLRPFSTARAQTLEQTRQRYESTLRSKN